MCVEIGCQRAVILDEKVLEVLPGSAHPAPKADFHAMFPLAAVNSASEPVNIHTLWLSRELRTDLPVGEQLQMILYAPRLSSPSFSTSNGRKFFSRQDPQLRKGDRKIERKFLSLLKSDTCLLELQRTKISINNSVLIQTERDSSATGKAKG